MCLHYTNEKRREENKHLQTIKYKAIYHDEKPFWNSIKYYQYEYFSKLEWEVSIGFLSGKRCAQEVWLVKENLLTAWLRERKKKRRTSSLFFCVLHHHNQNEEKEMYVCVERENFCRCCTRTHKSTRARRKTDVMWWRRWCCRDNRLCCLSGRSFACACGFEGQTIVYYHYIHVERETDEPGYHSYIYKWSWHVRRKKSSALDAPYVISGKGRKEWPRRLNSMFM